MIPIYIIHDEVAKYFKVDKVQMLQVTSKNDMIPRQWFHYLSRKYTSKSLKEIGKYYSDVTGRVFDHATVINSVKKISDGIDVYKYFKTDLVNLKLRLQISNNSTAIKNRKYCLNCSYLVVRTSHNL